MSPIALAAMAWAPTRHFRSDLRHDGQRLDRRAVSRGFHSRRRHDHLHDALCHLLRSPLWHGLRPGISDLIYGMMGNVSIGALFLGGFIPGAVMTIFMMLYVTYCARRYGMGSDQAFQI